MRITLMLAMLPLAAAAAVAAYGQRDRLTPLRLPDQRDQTVAVDGATRLILFSRDRTGNNVIKQAMEGLDPTVLKPNHVIYLDDISAMPRFITRHFALPKLRKYPYPVVLDHDGETTRRFPSKDGQATLIRLEDLVITPIEYTTNPQRVRVAIEAARH